MTRYQFASVNSCQMAARTAGLMTRQYKDPNRLHLRRYPGTATYSIVWNRRRIGQVEGAPILTKDGLVRPVILLQRKFSEQLVERIKDLLNNVMGTNHDFRVSVTPRADHPAIEKYNLRQRVKW